MTIHPQPTGLWLPIATPFKNGELDEASLRRMIHHYSSKEISGIILAATTGEGQLLNPSEIDDLVRITADELANHPSPKLLYLGVSGSDPVKIIEEFGRTSAIPIDGYLVSGPNYLRPSQEGLLEFFCQIAESTDKPIILYNIPYRTGVNIENETMLRLAELKNIVGVKDCCENPEQSYELLRKAPESFSVLTGEDPFFYNALVHGAPGAIVTGAHVLVDLHLEIMRDLSENRQRNALAIWNQIAGIPRLLFQEPNPAPLKYWLFRKGLIDSPEVRLPFMPVGERLAKKLNAFI